MRTRVFAIATLVFALSGLGFASFSTYDFAQHLDRQVHDIHCSFVPGLVAASSETSGCQLTLMSRYSSVLRTQFWGGIPISLPGMSVFAFLAFFATYLLVSGADRDKKVTSFTVAAWALPVLTSCVMAYFALVELDAVCKLCIGIYSSSLFGFLSALGLHLSAGAEPSIDLGAADATQVSGPPAALAPKRSVLWAIPLAGLFVLLPASAYVAAMPDYSPFAGGCGELTQKEDRYNVLVPLTAAPSGVAAIEVLDPLCSACKAFEGRLEASGLDERLSRRALLFPLDDECNWMVSSALHPGACAVSEAILCAPSQANDILAWSFANQAQIMQAERATDGAAARMVTAQFPSTQGCVGSTRIRSQLHRGLRWAVQNELPVLTPQLFVDGKKLCNEDTDLGLEYSLTQMLERRAGVAR